MEESLKAALEYMSLTIDDLKSELEKVKRSNNQLIPIATFLPAGDVLSLLARQQLQPATMAPAQLQNIQQVPTAPVSAEKKPSLDDILCTSSDDSERLLRDMTKRRELLTKEQEEAKRALEELESSSESKDLVEDISETLSFVDVLPAKYESNYQVIELDPVINKFRKSEFELIKKSLRERAERELIEPSEEEIEKEYEKLYKAWYEEEKLKIEKHSKKLTQKLIDNGQIGGNEFIQ